MVRSLLPVALSTRPHMLQLLVGFRLVLYQAPNHACIQNTNKHVLVFLFTSTCSLAGVFHRACVVITDMQTVLGLEGHVGRTLIVPSRKIRCGSVRYETFRAIIQRTSQGWCTAGNTVPNLHPLLSTTCCTSQLMLGLYNAEHAVRHKTTTPERCLACCTCSLCPFLSACGYCCTATCVFTHHAITGVLQLLHLSRLTSSPAAPSFQKPWRTWQLTQSCRPHC